MAIAGYAEAAMLAPCVEGIIAELCSPLMEERRPVVGSLG